MSIDYGRGTTNVAENGFRFGVIPHFAVGEAWYEDSQGVYPQGCPKCGGSECEEHDEEEDYDQEAMAFAYEDAEYRLTQDAESPDIWVIQSPYFTFTEYCSPCAPGAGYLRDAHDDGPCEALCLGHEWFRDNRAPYRVFSVETREEVLPPEA